MNKQLLAILFVLLMSTSVLPFFQVSSAIINSSSDPNLKGLSIVASDNSGIDSTNSQVSSDVAKASVSEHPITSSELTALKSEIGVYSGSDNYSQVIDGYGTGLRPPTAQEWTEIASNLNVIDTVNTQLSSPASVDQSATPYFPPIGNQGSQGSCVAWSVGYYVKTFQEAQEHGWSVSTATWQTGSPGAPTQAYQNEIISPAFIYNLQDGGADGGLTISGAINLVCNVGASSWATMPYNQTDYYSWPSQDAWTEAALYRGQSGSYQYMDLSTDQGIANLKTWLSSGHLASFGLDANKFPNLTSTDVFTVNNYVKPSIDHANTIVGYDDNFNYTEDGVQHFGAFKIANSWGVGGWEHVADGFYWISYAAMEQQVGNCEVFSDLADYKPSLAANVNISHARRGECSIEIGLGNPSSPTASKVFTGASLINGGNFSFCPNDMVLDISEFKNNVSSFSGQSFYLKVTDGGTTTTGTINRFSVDYTVCPTVPRTTVNGQAVTLTVTLPSFSTTCSLSTTSINLGQSVSVSGTVNASVADGVINLQYSTDNSTWSNISSGTPTAGTYSSTWTPSNAGTYYVRASWSGTANYKGSVSATQQLIVNANYTITTIPSGFQITVDSVNYTAPQLFNWAIGSTHVINAAQIQNQTAKNRYSFANWSDSGTQSHTLTVNSNSKTISANFKTQVPVNFYQSGVNADFVSPVVTVDGNDYNRNGVSEWLDIGSNSSFNYGSQLVQTQNGKQYVLVSANATSPMTITGPATVLANYTTQYYLSLTSPYGNASGQGWFDAGAQANFQISTQTVSGDAGTQYVFTSWSGTGNGSYTGTNTSQTISMNGAVAETANWQIQYQISLSVNPVGSGTTTPSGTNIWVNAGDLPISANATSDFSFSSWSTSDSITIGEQLANASTANVYGPGSIIANFIYQPGTNSTPTPSPTDNPNPSPTTAPSPTSNTTPTPSPTAHPSPTANPSSSPTATAKPASAPTSTDNPKTSPPPTSISTPAPSATVVAALTVNGHSINLILQGDIAPSQMSNVIITTNQSAGTTLLSFIVTGESGSTGVSNITIPKSAIPYGTEPTLYIDGQRAQDQEYVMDSYNYYVSYITHFSTHDISIVFKQSGISNASNSTTLWILLLPILVFLTLTALIIIVKKGLLKTGFHNPKNGDQKTLKS
jgi:hypothetical protein